MLVTKRGLIVAYINVLLVAAVISVAVIKTQASSVEKRQQYIDFIGLDCSDDPSKCGEHGSCLHVLQWDPESPMMCQCHDGWTSFDGYCDYLLQPQFNAFLASFFGGSVGADWFYLFRGGQNGGYGVAGTFKLLTFGGFSVWWLVDWIRVLTMTFPDGNGMRLYENLTDTDL